MAETQVTDVAIIGAGVVGCNVARLLSQYKLDVVVLERAHDVGEGSSKANSGIVHAGFQPKAGSLKGASCVGGNAAFPALCAALDVPYVECGGMMVAFDEAGVTKLEEKRARGLANGVKELPIVSGEAARELEPRLSPAVIAAMLAPATKVVSPFALVCALAENAAANGVQFCFNAEVERIEQGAHSAAGRYIVHLKDGSAVAARFVANCAGDAAALLDAQVHPADYTVRPRLGEYLVFDKQDPTSAITHVLYQAGSNDEGGTLLAPTVDGNLLAGPTSRNVRHFSETGSTREGLEHVRKVAQLMVPDLDFSNVIRNFAGVRANIVNVPKELKDFVVRASAPGFVSALGIKNPGLTASPVLAQRMVDLLAEEGLDRTSKVDWDGMRKAYMPFMERSAEEQAALLSADPAYGRVVCRCENITEGDVHAVLEGPLAPTTMAGVKRRLRLGMGRCQGAYCGPRLVEAMAGHMGCEPWHVPECEHGGRYVLRSVK